MALIPYEGHDIETLRDTLTRGALPAMRRLRRFPLRCPLDWLVAEILDDGAISHRLGYSDGAAGWGERIFERRHVEIDSITDNPGDLSRALTIKFGDVRGSLLRAELDPGVVDQLSDKLMMSRAACLSGSSFFFHGQPAWMEDPSGGAIVEVRRHIPKVSAAGFLVESYGENIVADSAFKTAVGSPWAVTGAGGSITADQSILIFDRAVTPQAYKIVSGTADVYVSQVLAQTPAANDRAWVSFDHYDPTGTGLSWYMNDVAAGTYWNAQTKFWVASLKWNPMPAGVSAPIRTGDRVTFATANPITLGIGHPLPAATKTSWIFHAQVEWGRDHAKAQWPGSRIVTGATWNWRSPDTYCIANSPDRRVFSAKQGTTLLRFTSLWNTADVAGLSFDCEIVRILRPRQPISDCTLGLFYDCVNSRWVVWRVANGVQTTILVPANVVAGVPINFAIRHSSNENGELNDLYGTPTGSNAWFDLLINGVVVGSAQGVQPPEADDTVIFVGGPDGFQMNGYVQFQHVPYVLSDAECSRWA